MKLNPEPRPGFSNVGILTVAVLLLAGVSSGAAGGNPTRQFDERGYRPNDVTLAPSRSLKNSGATVAGTGAWSLLGPPGGNVADVAVSTVDPNIVLAGTDTSLYRSTDGGNTWTEVSALTGTSVYDIEFAAGGKVYIATLDS